MKSLTDTIKKKVPWLVPFLMYVRNGTTKTMDKWSIEKLVAANQRHYKHRMATRLILENQNYLLKKYNGTNFSMNEMILLR